MARVSGMKEKLHMPSLRLDLCTRAEWSPAQILAEATNDQRVLRFFVDVQNKTRLETNLQAAGVLPSLNSFEARAMRVVFPAWMKTQTRWTTQINQGLEARFLSLI